MRLTCSSAFLRPPAGSGLSLACVDAANVSLEPPTADRFLRFAALDLSAATGLSLRNVRLRADCGSVLALQQWLCDTSLVAGSLQVRQYRHMNV
jgi:hypothetical protein